MISRGTWVEIHKIILEPGARAPQAPEDTQKVPLELKARGFLLGDARLSEQVEIRTLSGRVLSGTLSETNPGYAHSFGEPIPELLPIGLELKKLLAERLAGEGMGEGAKR